MNVKTLIFLFAYLTCSSCVSVRLATPLSHRASGIIYAEPSRPFKKDSKVEVDAAWKNNDNGNLISYLSDCKDITDPSLDSILQGSLSGLTDLKVEATQSPTVQGREARRMTATGRVDGVPTKIDLLAFKRNECIFILGYVGVPKAFDQDLPQFERFIQGFRAP